MDERKFWQGNNMKPKQYSNFCFSSLKMLIFVLCLLTVPILHFFKAISHAIKIHRFVMNTFRNCFGITIICIVFHAVHFIT